MQNAREKDIQKFYALLDRLKEKQPAQPLSDLNSSRSFPDRGIYFFFENGETRENGQPRVVRVGTHGLKEGSKSTLRGRLSQHRGIVSTNGGNHRGSIFRLLIGQALLAEGHTPAPSWGKDRPEDQKSRDEEHALEQAVSARIGDMTLLWLDIPDAPGPHSLRGFIERNSIALLSNFERAPIDPPSGRWLGLSSDRERVRKSGIWNNNHVTEDHDPEFLTILANLIDGKQDVKVTAKEATTSSSRTFVMQCAKSKRGDGWFRDRAGRAISFVADPKATPASESLRFEHPDGSDESGVPWRQRLIDYNRRHLKSGDNPFGLHSAAQLYSNPAYAKIAAATPPENLYILSACWGLVRSDFLLPNYDVSFGSGQNIPHYVRRNPQDEWRDFNMLDNMSTKPVIFIGGQRYLPAFVAFTKNYQGKRIAFFNSTSLPQVAGVEFRRFETDARTNWHYQLVDALLEGIEPLKLASPLIPTPPKPKPVVQEISVSKPIRKLGNHGKYTPLNRYLAGLPKATEHATLTFAQIEDILEAPLPNSAKKHVSVWWSNGGHAQAFAWMEAGFHKTGHRIGRSNEDSWIQFSRVN